MSFAPSPVAGRGFAVIDFETTGLLPEYHHRAVEVAVVHLDPDGIVTGHWDTLINPRRDLGPQRIHGIAAKDILGAPIFEEVAAQLIELLSGRVIVAHNASFDLRFLDAELDRLDYWRGDPWVSACTMLLARRHLGGGLSLADCCDAFGIPLDGAHRASVDALATARLLEAFLASSPGSEWSEMLAAAPVLPELKAPRAQWLARGSSVATAVSFLERIVVRIPDVSDTEEQAQYLALIDRCLIDRYLSEHEKAELVALADRTGIGRDTALRLHREYFVALGHAAWADGILTEDEASDLELVAALLDIPDALRDEVLSTPDTRLTSSPAVLLQGFALAPGDEIVLTGDMSRVRSEWEDDLRAAGYVPKAAVTKRVAVVVAADPDSLSGKARKARDYGIPVVGEAWLRDLLGQP